MAITVGELREILKDKPADTKVALSSNPEGNSYSLLTDCEDGYFWIPDYKELYDPDDPDSGEKPEDATPVIVLWP